MKNTIKYLFAITLVTFFSCNTQQNSQKKDAGPVIKMDSIIPAPAKKPFADVIFASKKDTTCGMPLTAGIADTLVLDGKIYGFCATECKDEFKKQLAANHKK